jgi:formylglycine-generating enzyme
VRPWAAALAIIAAAPISACQCDEERSSSGAASAAPSQAASARAPGAPQPQLLYLPDGGDVALTEEQKAAATGFVPPSLGRCPADMVDVRGRYCIDRYEAVLVDSQGRSLSPYFPPTREASGIASRFLKLEPTMADPPAMPVLPGFQRTETPRPVAQTRLGVIPNGYLSGVVARAACEAAGKRLCSLAEWETACRGQDERQFPYGARYEQGRCNVFREAHPAAELHGNASSNHLDPRLNLVQGSAGPLLRKTGATPACKSQWGNDAIYDMVGNLDEWIDDPAGTFVGGFYSRSSREGCSSRVEAHPNEYMDYSLGVRCCR